MALRMSPHMIRVPGAVPGGMPDAGLSSVMCSSFVCDQAEYLYGWRRASPAARLVASFGKEVVFLTNLLRTRPPRA